MKLTQPQTVKRVCDLEDTNRLERPTPFGSLAGKVVINCGACTTLRAVELS